MDGAAHDFASEALPHCMFIGYSDGARPLLQKAGIVENLYEAGSRSRAMQVAAAFNRDMREAVRYLAHELDVDLNASTAAPF